MTKNKTQCLSINLEEKEAQAFREFLKNLGFTRGKNVDLSGFGEAIAKGELLVFKRKNKICELVQDLINKEGRYDLAWKIGKLTNLEEIYPKFLDQIFTQIIKKEPFRLEYIDVAGEPFIFDCSYAQISTYSNRQYLEIRFINNIDSNSISTLSKNRCLRIDRIPETSNIYPLEEVKWNRLQTTSIQYLVKGSLAFAYKNRNDPNNDIEIISKTGQETQALISKEISNDFWFIRQILTYGSKATIVSPKPLKDKFIVELKKIVSQY